MTQPRTKAVAAGSSRCPRLMDSVRPGPDLFLGNDRDGPFNLRHYVAPQDDAYLVWTA